MLGTTDSAGDTDYYKYCLNAGQSSTIAATGLSGPVSLGLFDGSGNLLALPTGASLQSGGPVNLGGGFAGAGGLLTLNGSAQINGSNLELTDGGFGEASSAYSNTPGYVGSFSTSFNFQITPGTNPTADGFTFTIQGDGTNALGQGGGGLGYYTESTTASPSSSTFMTIPVKAPTRPGSTPTALIRQSPQST